MYPMNRRRVYKLLAVVMLLLGTAASAYPTVAKICEMRMQPVECPMHENNTTAPKNCCSMSAVPNDVTGVNGISTSIRIDEESIALLTVPIDHHVSTSSMVHLVTAPTTAPPPSFLKTTVLLI